MLEESDLEDLLKVLVEIASQWEKFALCLGVHYNQVQWLSLNITYKAWLVKGLRMLTASKPETTYGDISEVIRKKIRVTPNERLEVILEELKTGLTLKLAC